MSVSQRTKSLKSRDSRLSQPFYQLKVLTYPSQAGTLNAFDKELGNQGISGLNPKSIDVLQINVGKLCNQSCAHCHVDAGPDRKEIMSRHTLEQCLDVLKQHRIPAVDITGGAPELNPHFRWFIQSCSKLNIEIIHRCNLTVLVSNPRFSDLPDFFARHGVRIIASLPSFTQQRTDNQRGAGVFSDSIKALKRLNNVGYGAQKSKLLLDLVYNPSGAFLPGDQKEMENEFKRQLGRRHGIQFNTLFCIANLPVSRFLDYLLESGNYEAYMQELVFAFNPSTIPGLMCRSMISVSWDGYLYDCDFNQMLELGVNARSNHISRFNLSSLLERRIVTNNHCYGCTAGAGSSCGGSLV